MHRALHAKADEWSDSAPWRLRQCCAKASPSHMMRQTPGPFTNTQIELLKTFADQAVIAIENARLFDQVQLRTRELARSVEELQALGEVGRAVSSTLDLKVLLKTIVERAVQLSGTNAGSIFYYRKELGTFELGETTGL